MKELQKKISSRGIKLNPQRQAILEYLFNCRIHPTAEQIFEHVFRQCSRVTLKTVEKFLCDLKKAGFVDELQIEPGITRFDLLSGLVHHHFYCHSCKEVTDHLRISSLFENMNVEEMDGVENSAYGVSIILKGTCDKCMGNGNHKECGGME